MSMLILKMSQATRLGRISICMITRTTGMAIHTVIITLVKNKTILQRR